MRDLTAERGAFFCLFVTRWGLACAVAVAVAGDIDFLCSSDTRARLGWHGLGDERRSDKSVGLRRVAFVATALALPLKVGLFYAAARR